MYWANKVEDKRDFLEDFDSFPGYHHGFNEKKTKPYYKRKYDNKKIDIIVCKDRNMTYKCIVCNVKTVALGILYENTEIWKLRKCPRCGRNQCDVAIYIQNQFCLNALNSKEELNKLIKNFMENMQDGISILNRKAEKPAIQNLMLSCRIWHRNYRIPYYVFIAKGIENCRYKSNVYLDAESDLAKSCAATIGKENNNIIEYNQVEYVVDLRDDTYIRYDESYVELCKKKELGYSREEKSPKDEETVDIWVYGSLNNLKCIRDKHIIETCILSTVDRETGKQINLNVFYCEMCGKYFVNAKMVKNLIFMRKVPMVGFRFENYDSQVWKKESIFRILGYRADETMQSDHGRQSILKWIIDSKCCSILDVCNYLNRLIDYNGKAENAAAAKERWEKDLEFVSRYTDKNSRVILGNVSFRKGDNTR